MATLGGGSLVFSRGKPSALPFRAPAHLRLRLRASARVSEMQALSTKTALLAVLSGSDG
ncbi:hypothetical protein ACFPRL_21620 [Pseudoclavibacter helvolus]